MKYEHYCCLNKTCIMASPSPHLYMKTHKQLMSAERQTERERETETETEREYRQTQKDRQTHIYTPDIHTKKGGEGDGRERGKERERC